MPTREQNRAHWSEHDWGPGGEEWSGPWGSTAMLWYGTLLPRIHFALPATRLLEIAPGYGRVTGYLLEHCQDYTGVDITPRCVEACQQRFGERAGARFELTDGRSLDVVDDGSIDFALSWDSLVHADPDVLRAYVLALGRKLRPGGRAFLHHSNMGAFLDPASGRLGCPNPHWRDERMSALALRAFAAEAGLSVDAQELVQWGLEVHGDCLSWLSRPPAGTPPRVGPPPQAHADFGYEIGHLRWLHEEVVLRGGRDG